MVPVFYFSPELLAPFVTQHYFPWTLMFLVNIKSVLFWIAVCFW